MTTRFDHGFDPHHPLIEGDDVIFDVRLIIDEGQTPQPIPAGSVLTYTAFDEDPQVNSAATALFTPLTIGNGIEITDEDYGQIQVTIPAATTAGLAGDKFHRLRLTSGGSTRTPFIGLIRFRERASS